MKLLVDMNLSPRWVGVLCAADIEAVHWITAGRADAPDIEIMAFARAHDYVVLTHDLDFGSILAVTNGQKPSVVQMRSQDVTPERIGAMLISALRQLETELGDGALVTLDPRRTRVRLLPLRSQS
jgi:predicted nuclease of predicted toxin-antitoxin system